MKFVRTEDLKAGMRLAKPIYNKKGVLLYERNSALTAPGIASAKNFGLIGVYILEPAEPLPPLSREDLEFEQLQTVYIFRLREVLTCITERRKLEKYPVFLEDILSHYGSLKHRVNFNQNLRSSDDFMYKHAISTAILVTMMGAHLRLPQEKLRILTTAALLYDNGYRNVPRNILEKGMNELSSSDQDIIQLSLEKGLIPLSMYRNELLGYLTSHPQPLSASYYNRIFSHPINSIPFFTSCTFSAPAKCSRIAKPNSGAAAGPLPRMKLSVFSTMLPVYTAPSRYLSKPG